MQTTASSRQTTRSCRRIQVYAREPEPSLGVTCGKLRSEFALDPSKFERLTIGRAKLPKFSSLIFSRCIYICQTLLIRLLITWKNSEALVNSNFICLCATPQLHKDNPNSADLSEPEASGFSTLAERNRWLANQESVNATGAAERKTVVSDAEKRRQEESKREEVNEDLHPLSNPPYNSESSKISWLRCIKCGQLTLEKQRSVTLCGYCGVAAPALRLVNATEAPGGNPVILDAEKQRQDANLNALIPAEKLAGKLRMQETSKVANERAASEAEQSAKAIAYWKLQWGKA